MGLVPGCLGLARAYAGRADGPGSGSGPGPAQDPQAASNRGPGLKNLIAIGILGTIVLVKVVDTINEQNPRPRSLTESEYRKQQQRLKRLKCMFRPDEKPVYLLRARGGKVSKSEVQQLKQFSQFEIVDPDELVNREKSDPNSQYFSLLNDPSIKKLPFGLKSALIGAYLKQHDQPGTNFLVINFPENIKESVKFEENIVTIKKLLDVNETGSSAYNELVSYYKTVDKVVSASSLDQLAV